MSGIEPRGDIMERTVTGNNHKFVFSRDVVNGDLRVRSDDLVFGNQRFIFLELEIPQRARHSEVP